MESALFSTRSSFPGAAVNIRFVPLHRVQDGREALLPDISDQAVNEGHWPELLDRLFVVISQFENIIPAHPILRDHRVKQQLTKQTGVLNTYMSIMATETEAKMADYTFDGKRLIKKSSGQKLANVDRNMIRFFNGAVFGQIESKNLRDSHGKKVGEFDGKDVKDDRGKKVISIKEIQNLIEGEAGISMAAMWFFFVKDRKGHAGVLRRAPTGVGLPLEPAIRT